MNSWDREADVVIVGTGGAALSAAAAAAAAGASVAMLEADAEPGGTTKRSGGAFWIPNNRWMREAGALDSKDDALRLMARLGYPSLYEPTSPTLGLPSREHALLAAFYDEGSRTIDSLTQLGAIDPMILPPLGFGPHPLSDPDYHAELPENKAPYGRVLTAKTSPGSMEWPGAFLARGMLAHARAKGVEIFTEHRATGVLTNGQGEVTGVVFSHRGQRQAIRAKRGVVFGSGGHSHDVRKLLSFARGPLFGTGAVSSGTGVLSDAATALGARLGNMNNAFYFQVAVEAALQTAGAVSRPDGFVFLPYGDSMLFVDKRGRRIVNEKAMYHERTLSHFAYSGNEYPNLVQIMIWDEPVMREPTFWPWRGGVPYPGQTSPFVITAPSLPELADAIAHRLAGLQGKRGLTAAIGPDVKLSSDFVANLTATVERFNGFAHTGSDLDFRRGETPIEPAWQGPSRGTPNRTMTPLSATGPYYALLLGAGVLDTCGGPETDAQGRVLRADGTPIPGLYGAGNCVASPVGQGYFGAGGTIGPAMVFGFLAGEHAAARRAAD